jgi:hypothetical protein
VTRRGFLVAALAALEAWLLVRYREFGAQFHYFLHGFAGVAVGLALLTLVRARQQPGTGAWRVSPWLVAALGHVFSAFPDVLFLTVEALHVGWMDVFLAHISIHFIPAPFALPYALFALAVVSWLAQRLGRVRLGALVGVLVLATLAVALAVRDPLPRSLEEIRDEPAIALRCQLPV